MYIGNALRLLTGAIMLAMFATQVAAADKEWKFDVVNKSNVAAVEFRTQEDNEWSENWISSRIEPGDKVELDFGTDEGNCTVRTQIRFIDGTFFDADVDYCKASLLEIYNDKLIWKAKE